MKRIEALRLGGTLFVPADHKHLESVVQAKKFPALRSVVIDTEDGLGEGALETALTRIEALLGELGPTKLLRFIRPRDVDVLQRLLSMRHIDRLDGFLLPKFGLGNAQVYLDTLFPDGPASSQTHFMPSIEGDELFDSSRLITLRDLLRPYQEQVIVVRFGAEDMLARLALRRDCGDSLYEMVAPAQVIASMLNTFRPYGFDISAPVFTCYKDIRGFEQEVRRELREGLVSKTLIHPDQIALLERLYRVDERVLAEAKALLGSEKAVFAQAGKMAERTTGRAWAERIVKRARLYGIAEAI